MNQCCLFNAAVTAGAVYFVTAVAALLTVVLLTAEAGAGAVVKGLAVFVGVDKLKQNSGPVGGDGRAHRPLPFAGRP